MLFVPLLVNLFSLVKAKCTATKHLSPFHQTMTGKSSMPTRFDICANLTSGIGNYKESTSHLYPILKAKSTINKHLILFHQTVTVNMSTQKRPFALKHERT